MRNRKLTTRLLATLALAAGIGLCWQTGIAQVKKGKTRMASTKAIMSAGVLANCGACANALKDAGPADDKAWAKVAAQAEMLNELGYTLMADGRCPDDVWANAVKAMQEGSQKLAEAAAAKNLSDAQAAMKTVTGSCATCHGAHKK
jgi:hypothetical protein